MSNISSYLFSEAFGDKENN